MAILHFSWETCIFSFQTSIFSWQTSLFSWQTCISYGKLACFVANLHFFIANLPFCYGNFCILYGKLEFLCQIWTFFAKLVAKKKVRRRWWNIIIFDGTSARDFFHPFIFAVHYPGDLNPPRSCTMVGAAGKKKEERGSSRSIDKHRPASFESGVNLSSRFFYVQLKLIASSSHISVSVFIYGGMSYKGSSVDVHRLPCSNWLLCFVMPPIIFNLKVFFCHLLKKSLFVYGWRQRKSWVSPKVCSFWLPAEASKHSPQKKKEKKKKSLFDPPPLWPRPGVMNPLSIVAIHNFSFSFSTSIFAKLKIVALPICIGPPKSSSFWPWGAASCSNCSLSNWKTNESIDSWQNIYI